MDKSPQNPPAEDALQINGPITIDPCDPEVRGILGWTCVSCIGLANKLRACGWTIKSRAENEQAAVLLWLLSLYQKYGKSWREDGQKELNAMLAKGAK